MLRGSHIGLIAGGAAVPLVGDELSPEVVHRLSEAGNGITLAFLVLLYAMVQQLGRNVENNTKRIDDLEAPRRARRRKAA